MVKTCSSCGLPKDPDKEFHRDDKSADGRGSWCKSCKSEKDKPQRRFRRYGITQQQYDFMMFKQRGLCAICEQPETRKDAQGRTAPLAVDHCHKTGTVRGLLCHGCNTAIGLLGECAKRLLRAIQYLAGARA